MQEKRVILKFFASALPEMVSAFVRATAFFIFGLSLDIELNSLGRYSLPRLDFLHEYTLKIKMAYVMMNDKERNNIISPEIFKKWQNELLSIDARVYNITVDFDAQIEQLQIKKNKEIGNLLENRKKLKRLIEAAESFIIVIGEPEIQQAIEQEDSIKKRGPKKGSKIGRNTWTSLIREIVER